MAAVDRSCVLCTPDDAAAMFGRRTVWANRLWRVSLIEDGAPVAGFGHLEPVRHIPHITDLDGPEATTLGEVLADVTSALKQATGAPYVYVYVFGERVAHLHFNLAPHHDGDALAGGPGLLRLGAPPIDPALLRETNRAVERLLLNRA